jgi:hypothetical protein
VGSSCCASQPCRASPDCLLHTFCLSPPGSPIVHVINDAVYHMPDVHLLLPAPRPSPASLTGCCSHASRLLPSCILH